MVVLIWDDKGQQYSKKVIYYILSVIHYSYCQLFAGTWKFGALILNSRFNNCNNNNQNFESQLSLLFFPIAQIIRSLSTWIMVKPWRSSFTWTTPKSKWSTSRTLTTKNVSSWIRESWCCLLSLFLRVEHLWKDPYSIWRRSKSVTWVSFEWWTSQASA